jgi:hypothetical protein
VAVTTIGGRLSAGGGSPAGEKFGNKIKNRRTQKKTIEPLLFPRKGNVEADRIGLLAWASNLIAAPSRPGISDFRFSILD